MSPVDLQAKVRAIVVADSNDSFAHAAIFLLKQFGVDYVLFRDVYGATSEIVNDADISKELLVIGDIKKLSYEHGRFFEICSRRQPVTYCCFAKSRYRLGSDEIAGSEHVFIAADIMKLEQKIEQLLRFFSSGSEIKKKSQSTLTGKEVFEQGQLVNARTVLSDDELEALLGSG